MEVCSPQKRTAFCGSRSTPAKRVYSDLPVTVAAASVRITLPPIHCGKAIPVGAQPRQHRLNLGEELCSVLFGSAGLKGIGDLAASVIDKDARSSGLGAREVPVCSTEIAGLAETDAVNFAGASPSAVIEASVRIFRRRVQEENTLLPVTQS